MKTESTKFITKLSARRWPQHLDLTLYNQDEWFRGSYNTVQRRIPAGTITPKSKNQIKIFLFSEFPKLKESSFDQQMEEMVCSLSSKHPLTIGQSQKIINILLKYHACRYYAGTDSAWNSANVWIADINHVQHVPVDSIVLKAIYKINPKNGTATIDGRVEKKIEDKDVKTPWSKISDYETYFKIQKIVRALARSKNISPIEFEMKYLW